MKSGARIQSLLCKILIIIIVIVVIKHSFHIINQFYPRNVVTTTCLTRKGVVQNSSATIYTKHIHQIFISVPDVSIPKHFDFTMATWQLYQPDFKFTLWNSTMIENLLSTRYPELEQQYFSYGHWIRQVDMAKYAILYDNGGIYIDMDITSSGRKLSELGQVLKPGVSTALYLTEPFGVATDFIISKPNDPFMEHVLCGLSATNHWYIFPYLTTMMTTGPAYLYSRYLSYDHKDTVQLLDQITMSYFVHHLTGGTWHQWDGKLIWWGFKHKDIVVIYLLVFVILAIIACTLLKYAKIGHFFNATRAFLQQIRYVSHL